MLRDASMIAAAPLPVPPPYETVPSYAIGQTRTREFSKLENSSSAIPPKFMGRDCDSDMKLSHRVIDSLIHLALTNLNDSMDQWINESTSNLKARQSSDLCLRT